MMYEYYLEGLLRLEIILGRFKLSELWISGKWSGYRVFLKNRFSFHHLQPSRAYVSVEEIFKGINAMRVYSLSYLLAAIF